VHTIVGYAPGGVTDITARLICPWLSQRLGQQFVVENHPGASGNIAAEVVARASPDGYTLLLVATNNAYNATLYDNLRFNFIRDIVPVASICRDCFVMVVNPSFPAKTVAEFIVYAKSNRDRLNLARSIHDDRPFFPLSSRPQPGVPSGGIGIWCSRCNALDVEVPARRLEGLFAPPVKVPLASG
jgi:tripartite-type tricarboxylate transporter receptor subunit TctC